MSSQHILLSVPATHCPARAPWALPGPPSCAGVGMLQPNWWGLRPLSPAHALVPLKGLSGGHGEAEGS